MTGTTYDGSLTLEVHGTAWRRTQRPPQSLTVLERPDHLLVIPADQSGGLRGGDTCSTSVAVADGGHVAWKQASSSLFYPSADRQAVCRVNTRLSVGHGCGLTWLPKVAIPCAGALVVQTSEIHSQAGAELLFWDSWADGRTSSGERAAFGSLGNQLEFHVDGRLVFRERWLLHGGFAASGCDPAGFQGACQWHLGLAIGIQSYRALQERVAHWKSVGETVACGELEEGVWIARALCHKPRAI